MAKRVFEGLKIVDFGWMVVGPLTVKYLADQGAQVIHVESATHIDALRGTPPFKDQIAGINRSAYQLCLNNNKYGLALNMRHPKSRTCGKTMSWKMWESRA